MNTSDKTDKNGKNSVHVGNRKSGKEKKIGIETAKYTGTDRNKINSRNQNIGIKKDPIVELKIRKILEKD